MYKACVQDGNNLRHKMKHKSKQGAWIEQTWIKPDELVDTLYSWHVPIGNKHRSIREMDRYARDFFVGGVSKRLLIRKMILYACYDCRNRQVSPHPTHRSHAPDLPPLAKLVVDTVNLKELACGKYRVLVTGVDWKTKMAFTTPVESKEASSVIYSFKKWFLNLSRKPLIIQTDNGTEFLAAAT
jgi:hypothetical protein